MRKIHFRTASKTALAASLLLFGMACSKDTYDTDNTTSDQDFTQKVTTETAAKPEIDYNSIAWSAVSHPDRPAADREDDEARKPAEALAFFQVSPGISVLELEAGQGYYTELLSRAVGDDGKVFMQNPPYFDKFFGEEGLEPRLGGNRLPNVVATRSQFDVLEPGDASIDLVTWVLGPHELFFFPDDGPDDGFGDATKSFEEIFRVLKPGGLFGVIDHAAAEGSTEETGGTTHRIDPAIVISMGEAAGLELAAQGTALANPADDYEKNVFDDSVRRKTDRFMLRFRKPL